MRAGGAPGSRDGLLSWAADFVGTLDLWTGAVFRAVRPRHGGVPVVAAWRRLMPRGLLAIAAVVLAMLVLDERAIRFAGTLPDSINRPFNWFTDFGQSQWFLVPFGLLYLAMVALAAGPVARSAYGVLATLAARFGFLFVAIGMPSLLVTIVKRIIGRVRPSDLGPFAYEPFSWRSAYASLPSGHTTTAFAALVAIGFLVPRARALLWVFAVLMAVSRVVVSTHFPSDVIAGAAFGAFGAVVVRDWFAARRLVFYLAPDGEAHRWPGPSFGRIKRVARSLFGP